MHVVRQLLGERRGLGGQRRDRGGQEGARHADHGQHHNDDGRRARQAASGDPADRRIQAGRDEQRQADQDQHGPRPDYHLDEAIGDRHACGCGHPDEERRPLVQRPARMAKAVGLLGDRGRCVHRLLHAVLALVRARSCPHRLRTSRLRPRGAPDGASGPARAGLGQKSVGLSCPGTDLSHICVAALDPSDAASRRGDRRPGAVLALGVRSAAGILHIAVRSPEPALFSAATSGQIGADS